MKIFFQQAILLYGVALLFLNACSTPDSIGEGILPSANMIESPDTFQVQLTSQPITVDSLFTDLRHPFSLYYAGKVNDFNSGVNLNFLDYLYAPLGSINDPQFGQIDASFATEFLLNGSNIRFGKDAALDSVTVQFRFYKPYGDKNYVHNLEVYELDQRLPDESTRFPINKVPVFKGQDLCVRKSFTVNTDSFITKSFRLSDDFGRKILNADTNSVLNNDNSFAEFFKGIYVRTSPAQMPNTGVAHSISILSPENKLVLHYKYTKDSTYYDTLKMQTVTIPIRKTVAFGLVVNDKTRIGRTALRTAAPGILYDRVITQKQDTSTLALVQGGMPVRLGIKLKDISTLKSKVINYAELILKVDDSYAFNLSNTKPPSNLYLYGAADPKSPDKFAYNRAITSAVYDSVKKQYLLRITPQLQQMVNGRENPCMILSALDYVTNERMYNRAVIGNYLHPTLRPSLRVLYTEIPK